jgi:hypothetical protein
MHIIEDADSNMGIVICHNTILKSNKQKYILTLKFKSSPKRWDDKGENKLQKKA